jgi:hypothetical protein
MQWGGKSWTTSYQAEQAEWALVRILGLTLIVIGNPWKITIRGLLDFLI